jgi:hypothetical protein
MPIDVTLTPRAPSPSRGQPSTQPHEAKPHVVVATADWYSPSHATLAAYRALGFGATALVEKQWERHKITQPGTVVVMGTTPKQGTMAQTVPPCTLDKLADTLMDGPGAGLPLASALLSLNAAKSALRAPLVGALHGLQGVQAAGTGAGMAVGQAALVGVLVGVTLLDDPAPVIAQWPQLSEAARDAVWFSAAGVGASKTLEAVLRLDPARVNKKDPAPALNTALHYASLGGHTEAVQILLRWGADPQAENPVGTLPFHDAARGGYADLLALLCAQDHRLKGADGAGTRVDMITRRNQFQDSVFHRIALGTQASRAKDYEAAFDLAVKEYQSAPRDMPLEAFLNLPNGDGLTALDIATARGETPALCDTMRGLGAQQRADATSPHDANTVAHIQEWEGLAERLTASEPPPERS